MNAVNVMNAMNALHHLSTTSVTDHRRPVAAHRVKARTVRTSAPRRRRVRRLPRRHLAAAPRQRPTHPTATRSVGSRRRRLLLVGSLLTGVVGCGLLSNVLFAGSGGPAAAAPRETFMATRDAVVARQVMPGIAPRVVVAEQGDSLWSIAERHRGDIPVGDYVAQLAALNGGPALRVGDVVVLPA